ncbi:MAG: EamA family transporter, partial [Rhodospirillaceae bacterium]
YIAAHSTAAINIGIIQGALPVFVMLGAYAIYRTPVTFSQTIGVAVTMTGVIMVAARGDLGRIQELAFNHGDLLMVGACILYAAYTIALRERPAASGLAVFSVMAVAALCTALPLAVGEFFLGEFQWPTLAGLAVILFVVIFPSFLSQLFFL